MHKVDIKKYRNCCYNFLGRVWLYAFLVFALLSLLILSIAINTPSFFVVVFGSLTACFSYLAYKYTKEKFRLDLLERRFEIYSNAIESCSSALFGGFNSNDEAKFQHTLDTAEKSFRGIGSYKTRVLFDEDIHGFFKELNKSFTFLHTYHTNSSIPHSAEEKAQQAKDYHFHTTLIADTERKLPDLFKPYIYFGDYKRD